MPSSRISSYARSKAGHCQFEQVGVNAPGSEKTTTRLPLNSSTLPTSCQRYGLGTGTVSSRTRVLNIKSGTGRPSVGREERYQEIPFRSAKNVLRLPANAPEGPCDGLYDCARRPRA